VPSHRNLCRPDDVFYLVLLSRAYNLTLGLTSTNLITFASVPVVLLVAARAASYVPARRAMRVDPMLALRDD
jgi:putative ABC transport system permease protein